MTLVADWVLLVRPELPEHWPGVALRRRRIHPEPRITRESCLMPLLALVFAPAALGAEPPLNPPPPGFIALFNGKDLTNWKDEGKAKGHWTIRDGALYYDGKGDSLVTSKDYGDFELYVDWKILPKGDSGIYLRGNPQVQIWDDPIG